ncbi:MAG: helix-turn-helix domain-containing protein [Calditrichaceae bacterium]
MKKNFKDLSKEIDDFFQAEPNSNQKAWGIINDFYHLILTHMEENSITKADLARKLNKSRSAISQMFNKTPNISVIKMVEIADAVGIDFNILPKGEEINKVIYIQKAAKTVFVPITKENWNEISTMCEPFDYNLTLFKSQSGMISANTSSYNTENAYH